MNAINATHPVRGITCPAWRRLSADTRGIIAGCDTCAFWRWYIVPCATHSEER